MLVEQKFPPINKILMRSALENIHGLYDELKKWKTAYPEAFRIDGHHAVGPANPAQWIFFKLDGITSETFSGMELGHPVDGSKWNGMYYLTASTRMESVEHFLNLYEKHNGDPSKIFSLSYTEGKEGQPSKRKLFLKDADERVNSGWFCKQYFDRYNPNR